MKNRSPALTLQGRRGAKKRWKREQSSVPVVQEHRPIGQGFEYLSTPVTALACAGARRITSTYESPTAIAFEALALHDRLQVWPHGVSSSSRRRRSSSSSSSAGQPRVPSARFRAKLSVHVRAGCIYACAKLLNLHGRNTGRQRTQQAAQAPACPQQKRPTKRLERLIICRHGARPSRARCR